MLPTHFSSTRVFSHLHQLDQCLTPRLNTPEEDDETMSTQHKTSDLATLESEGTASTQDKFRALRLDMDQDLSQLPDTFHRGLMSPYGNVYAGPTPFHSRADQSWGQSQHSHGTSSCCCYSGPPLHQHHNSLPSKLSYKEYMSCSEESCLSCHKSLGSLPSTHSSSLCSLEQPLSLHSIPPLSDLGHHTLSPFFCSPQGAPCCAQCSPEQFNRGVTANKKALPQYHPRPRPIYPGDFRLPGPAYTHTNSNHIQAKSKTSSLKAPLSLEQRRVFVTYEADSEKHVNEVINFVALLRHNGFDTHIDIFEQQFQSISTIDFMEHYLSEKEYLIIIIISPKYYSTVIAPPEGHEQDAHTFNTVYIHKQLQNEFIQNGSKNFRFIPILFPGAKRGHVPAWLQNTNIYAWPRDRDDILRRLMRVEKYNPPPIGDLPTIVSIPI